jgi:hypothetical protein
VFPEVDEETISDEVVEEFSEEVFDVILETAEEVVEESTGGETTTFLTVIVPVFSVSVPYVETAFIVIFPTAVLVVTMGIVIRA